MKKLNAISILALVAVLLSSGAQAAYKRQSLNIKLPSQYVMDHTKLSAPIALDADRILAGAAGATSASPVTVTTFLAQPDVARNITVLPTGTTADVAAGNVVVSGTNILGAAISESFAFIANQSTAVVGTKAFRTVTSIVFPGEDSPFGATWDVGIGDKLGLKHCLDGAGYAMFLTVDAAAATGTTVTGNATALESNGFTPNPAANASRVFDQVYVQNYRCGH